MPAEGLEPPTNGLQSSDLEFQGLIFQTLAALASPVPRPTKAQLRHTQAEVGTILAQSISQRLAPNHGGASPPPLQDDVLPLASSITSPSGGQRPLSGSRQRRQAPCRKTSWPRVTVDAASKPSSHGCSTKLCYRTV